MAQPHREGTCRNCGEQVTSNHGSRWCSDEHGDICYKSHLDQKSSPTSAIRSSRLHAVDEAVPCGS